MVRNDVVVEIDLFKGFVVGTAVLENVFERSQHGNVVTPDFVSLNIDTFQCNQRIRKCLDEVALRSSRTGYEIL